MLKKYLSVELESVTVKLK